MRISVGKNFPALEARLSLAKSVRCGYANAATYFWSGLLGHADYGEEFAIRERDLEIFLGYVASRAE